MNLRLLAADAMALPALSEQRREAVLAAVRLLTQVAFGTLIVLSPFRARWELAARPDATVYGDYTDFLLYWSDVALIAVLALWGLSLLISGRRPWLGPAAIRWPVIALVLATWASDPVLRRCLVVRLQRFAADRRRAARPLRGERGQPAPDRAAAGRHGRAAGCRGREPGDRPGIRWPFRPRRAPPRRQRRRHQRRLVRRGAATAARLRPDGPPEHPRRAAGGVAAADRRRGGPRARRVDGAVRHRLRDRLRRAGTDVFAQRGAVDGRGARAGFRAAGLPARLAHVHRLGRDLHCGGGALSARCQALRRLPEHPLRPAGEPARRAAQSSARSASARRWPKPRTRSSSRDRCSASAPAACPAP